MKKALLFFQLCLLTLVSCSRDTISDVNNSTPQLEQSVYGCDPINTPQKWAKLNTMEEMLAACRLSEENLKEVSTNELIDLCMKHPLAFTITAHNNEMNGAKVIFDSFNGFAELKQRTDAAQSVIEYYKNISLNGDDSRAGGNDMSSPIALGFVELYLASDQLPELYSPKYLPELKKVVTEKYAEKENFPQRYMMFSLRKSYLLQATIMINENSLSASEKSEAMEFVNSGGRFSSENQFNHIKSILKLK